MTNDSSTDGLPDYFPDPYDSRPGLLQRHAGAVAAVAVFVLTAVLLVLSFPPGRAPEFAYVMLVPGIFWAYTRPAFRLYAWVLLGAQMLGWTIVLSWLHHVTWVGLLLLGPLVGGWVGSWYLLAWWVIPRLLGRPTATRLMAVLGLAAAWVLIEWTRTWMLGGFPWLPLAASQWERSSILQVAVFTGSYGVSFVLVVVNIGFAAYAHRLIREGAVGFGKRSQEFFLALFLLMVCLSIHFQEAFHRGRYSVPLWRVALVQPNIPQEVKWDPARGLGIMQILEQTTLAAAATLPDLILWPEAVTPWAVRGDSSTRSFVEALVRKVQRPLLFGSLAVEPDADRELWFNGAFVASPAEGVATNYYAKRRLVPFGEFVPFRPLLGWIGKFVPIGGDFTPGFGSAPLVVLLRDQTNIFGPLICYEDVYPQLARESVLGGAEILAVLTNNSWFGEGGAAFQHAAHSVLRAVENRRPVLRVGNSGWSGWIDEFGVVRAVLTDESNRIYFRGTETLTISRDARWLERRTFYSRHGDWFVFCCLLLAGFGYAVLRAGERRNAVRAWS